MLLIITLVDLDDTLYKKKKEIGTSARATRHTMDQFSPKRGLPNSGMRESVPQMRINYVTDLSRMNTMNAPPIPPESSAKAFGKPLEDPSKIIDKPVQDKIPLDSKMGTTVKEADNYQSHPATEPHIDGGGTDPALPSDVRTFNHTCILLGVGFLHSNILCTIFV